MRLRKFIAPSMPEAMALVREALGDDAIIVSAEDEAGKVQVTAAAEERDDGAIPAIGDEADITDRLSEALSANGAPGVLAEKLLMASLSFDTGDELTALAGALGAIFTFAPVPEFERTRPLLLVG